MPFRLLGLPELRPLGRLARLSWLSLLFVLALHPAALAGQMGSSGLAVLLREILCGCATCAVELETLDAPAGCCERESAPARTTDCGGTGDCTCTHPDEVPLGESTPLARPADSRRDLLAAATIHGERLTESVVACEYTGGSAPTSVDCRPPPGYLPDATRERRVRATRDRLAWLVIYLI